MYRNLPSSVVRRVEQLIDASYSGRDELYAAADSLDDKQRSHVCRRLADHLAGHATELQQLIRANGGEVVEPFDMYHVAEAYFRLVKARDGDSGILSVAEDCERTVKERFEKVIEDAQDDDTRGILNRQRDEIEFGENVLNSMQTPPKKNDDSKS